MAGGRGADGNTRCSQPKGAQCTSPSPNRVSPSFVFAIFAFILWLSAGLLLFYFCHIKKPELLFRLIGRLLKLAHLVRLRRRTWASPTTPLPRRRSDEGSGVTTTPEIPDTRGCRKSSNPPAESIVTLTIVSLLMVVMVRKLLPFVLPYGPKLNTVPSPIVTLMFRSLSLAGLNGFRMKSRKVCPGT